MQYRLVILSFAFFFFTLNTVSFYSHAKDKAGSAGANTPKRGVIYHQKMKRAKKKARTPEKATQTHFYRIGPAIDYTWGPSFRNDIKNFESYPIFDIKNARTRQWLILVNIHGPARLNTQTQFVPGTRSLAWATPLLWAQTSLTALAHSHSKLALLKSWSKGAYRQYVTFILIPEDTAISFLIGSASPQGDSETEWQPGGDVQLRLKYLPTGSILLTMPLLSPGKDLMHPKAKKKVDLISLLKQGLSSYNKVHEEAPINFHTLQENYAIGSTFSLHGHHATEIKRDIHTHRHAYWIKEFLRLFFEPVEGHGLYTELHAPTTGSLQKAFGHN